MSGSADRKNVQDFDVFNEHNTDMRMQRALVSLVLLGAVVPLANSQTAVPPAQPNIRELKVTFKNGDITLAGTLLLPDSSVPAAAIVLTHGSGPQTRNESRPFAERFVRDGFAALIYDKRGSGGSGGKWYAASLDDISDDAIAAAAFLKSRNDIDGQHIGIWGVSQAGWVNPHAIARAPGMFAFAVVITGGAVKPIDVERYDYNQRLEDIRATAEERRDAMALVEKYFEYLKTGNGLTELESEIAAAASKPWARAVDLSRVVPSVGTQKKWVWVPSYDPEPDIVKLTVPILVVLGSRDRPGLAEVAEERWRVCLLKSGNPDATVVVFLSGGHGITTGHHHNDNSENKYASGYFELLDSWLRLHSATPRP